jgi:hypothetical protein
MTDQETTMTDMTPGTPATYTGTQLRTALATTEQRIHQAAGDDGVDDVFSPVRDCLVIDGNAAYTREDFSAMLNEQADIIADAHDGESSETIWEDTVANLVVNAASYLLEHPGAELDEIITHAWADLDGDIDWPEEYDSTPDDQLPAKGTPEHDAAIVATVLGWVS